MDVNVSTRRNPRPDGGLAPFLLVGVAGALVLATVGLWLDDRVPAVDAWGLDALRLRPGSVVEDVTVAVSDGLRLVCVAAAVASVGSLLWRGRRPALAPALGYVALFLLLAGSSEILKGVFGRPHPGDPADMSYPSTHVAMVTAAVLVGAGIVGRLATGWRTWLAVLAVAAVAGTAATRVLLGEHHLTDVLGTAFGYAGVGLLGVRLLRLPSADRYRQRIDGEPVTTGSRGTSRRT